MNYTISIYPTFDDFWDLYAYKLDRTRCERLWSKMSQGEKEKAMQHAEIYVQRTHTDGRYPSRRHPGTYLHNRNWNDDALIPAIVAPTAASKVAELDRRFDNVK